MKPTDRYPDLYGDREESWAYAIATFAVFIAVCVALYLAILTAGAIR